MAETHRIGVLAIQGSVQEHCGMLAKVGATPVEARVRLCRCWLATCLLEVVRNEGAALSVHKIFEGTVMHTSSCIRAPMRDLEPTRELPPAVAGR